MPLLHFNPFLSDNTLQLLAGLVPLAAPGAPEIGTGEGPEAAPEMPGLRELIAHPGRLGLD